MPDDLSAFADEVLAELGHEARGLLDEVSAEQAPIVRQVARDIAKYALLYVKEPDRREVHARTLRHLRGILESESALAQLRAAARVREAIERVVRQALELALGHIRA